MCIRRLFMAFLCFFCLAPAVEASSIYIVNGHEYDVIGAGGITWDDARSAALAMGGGWDLATIGDAGENTFVEGLLPASPVVGDRSHFFIGATDRVLEGTWLWVDGTPFAFTDWWPLEPNNGLGGGEEDFLAYDLRLPSGSYAWNDIGPVNSGLIRGYVIERVAPQQVVPEPTSLLLVGSSVVGLLVRRRRSHLRSRS